MLEEMEGLGYLIEEPKSVSCQSRTISSVI